ncbi:hypothetical protein AB990_02445 [Alkalihalobacillus pseudalcaliphilus]|nr:hypothetical protein AB990_02445 [Alkalihalobacillus pseudalcaliphilus]
MYEPTNDTLYFRTAFEFDYETEVKEYHHVYKVKQTDKQILDYACLKGGATYEGRKRAVIHNTGIQSKVPIPVDPLRNLYIFPTHSPESDANIWIVYHNVDRYIKHPTDKTKSIIIFKNREQLVLDVSYSSIKNQVHNTAYCVSRFGRDGH